MRQKPWPALQTKLNPSIVLYQGFSSVYNAGPQEKPLLALICQYISKANAA